jgi:hypothetical protein
VRRDRLLNQEVAQKFFQRVLQQAQAYLSDEHFTVDGTLIEACASQKSFQNYSPTLSIRRGSIEHAAGIALK